jgi:molybdopterin-guanine dinucleotide biosynthesis protein A
MGTNKAFLPWNGTTIVQHLASVIGMFAAPVSLVGRASIYAGLGLPCLSDLRPGLGPLGGLEAALLSTSTEWNIVLACDMLGVDEAILFRLCRAATESRGLAVLLRDGCGEVHPLCGLYRRGCLDTVKRALDGGELRVMKVVKTLQPTYVEIASIVLNVNTAEEWKDASLSDPSHGK